MKFIKFFAPWCAPCHNLQSTLESLAFSEKFDLSQVQQVNIEEDIELAQKFNVRGIPVMVAIDDSGVEINRITGSPTTAKLKEFLGITSEPIL